MIVMKFGGTSVRDADAIKNTTKIVQTREDKKFVVVSALSGVTNTLVYITEQIKTGNETEALQAAEALEKQHLDTALELGVGAHTVSFIKERIDKLKMLITALDIVGEVSPKSADMIFSLGEILSSRIIYDYMHSVGMQVHFVDSGELIKTDDSYTEAEVEFEITNKRISDFVSMLDNSIDTIICGGFIAMSTEGVRTTLGRGGSDFSAAIIASAISAEKLEIWTDVDGIMTCDPRIVPGAKKIASVSYTEASELAYFGAKVLHPKTIFPAVQRNIPVYVLNSFNPDSSGTLIKDIRSNENHIKAIAFRRGITVINITSNRMLGAYGFLSKVFEVFRDYETSVDLITTSEVSISLTIDNTWNLPDIISDLEKFAAVEIREKMSIISAVGEGIRNTSGIAARFFGVLSGVNIPMVSVGASEINLSIVVKEDDLENALKLLHGEFFSNN